MAGDSPNNKLSSLEPYLEPFCYWEAQQISAASRDRETIGHKAKYESFDWALCCEQSVDRPLMAMFVGLETRKDHVFR